MIVLNLYRNLPVDEKANVLTHGAGLVISVIVTALLAILLPVSIKFWGLTIFGSGLITMFFCSTFYHLANREIRKNRWRILDHISIFILIGCSYTAFILIYFNTPEGIQFLKVHWIIILSGILFKLVFKTKYEIVSLALYLFLGWMVVWLIDDLLVNMPTKVFYWLIAGGLAYTVGVYFYVRTKLAWHHAIWHIFVILGGTGHYIALLIS